MPRRVLVVRAHDYQPDWRPPSGCRLMDWDGWTGVLLAYNDDAVPDLEIVSEHDTYATAAFEVRVNR